MKLSTPQQMLNWLRLQARCEVDAARHAETAELAEEHRALARDFVRAARRFQVEQIDA
jgi:hypothetical protein